MSLTVKKIRLINLAILCTTCATLYCAPSFKTASSGFKDIWAREFMFKPVISLNDRRAHVETWLLGGYEHRTSMLCILLSDMLFTSFDDEYVFNAEIPRHYFFNRAEWLKREKLSDSETQAVKALFEKCAKKHPSGSCLNYAFLPDFLKRTMGKAQDMETVLFRIASNNGCLCDHAVSENPTSGQLFQLLSEGCTPILERKSVDNWNFLSKDDGKWRLVFGSFTDGNGKLQFLMNIPEETTLMERWRWNGTSNNALESIHLGTIYEKNMKRNKLTGYFNIRSNIDNMICNNGFMLLPASELPSYRLHAIRHWRRSAGAWDGELRQILGLPEATKQPHMAKPSVEAAPKDIWKYYFHENKGSAGFAFDGGFIPRWRIAEGPFAPLQKALLSAIATHKPDFVAFGLSFPGRLFHASRLFLGNSLLMPTQPELNECKALADSVLGLYQATFGEVPTEPFHWDDPEFSNDHMERHHPGYKSRHSLQDHLFHSLPRILEGATSVKDAVSRMERQCAWTATVEGGPKTDWDTVKLAIWRRIPVILEGNDGDWRMAVAYVVHDGRRLLLATKKQEQQAELPETALKEYTLPEELPEGMEFIDFDAIRWTPWFAHHFKPSVSHLAPQILQIFRNHPEAKEYLQTHHEIQK